MSKIDEFHAQCLFWYIGLWVIQIFSSHNVQFCHFSRYVRLTRSKWTHPLHMWGRSSQWIDEWQAPDKIANMLISFIIPYLPVKAPWPDLESHSQEMQRSIYCTCSWGGQWRCPPRCCTSPPPSRPPWTCTRCWPGASWGCPPGRARWPWGSRRARPVQ